MLRRRKNSEAMLLGGILDQIARSKRTRVTQVMRALRKRKAGAARYRLNQMQRIAHLEELILEHAIGGLPARQAVPRSLPTPAEGTEVEPLRYSVNYLALASWAAAATQGTTEHLFAITGSRLDGGVLTLGHAIKVQADEATRTSVVANDAAFFKLLLALNDADLSLHALLHSHRFDGVPRPSGVDLQMQEWLRAGGYPAIQAIVSEDGYVHFFGDSRGFEVSVHGGGDHVQRIDSSTFRIDVASASRTLLDAGAPGGVAAV